MNYASLCLLSYKRQEFLIKTLNSLIKNTSYPYELIVHDDGSGGFVVDTLIDFYSRGKVSWLVLNRGKNMGIGKAIQNCLGIASGEYLFKIDSDLEFKQDWLKIAVSILDNPGIGCLSLFNYRNYDPQDNRFNILEEKDNYYIVDDFVSSIYGFKRDVFEKYGDKLGTDGWHQYLKTRGYQLAITKQDYVVNFGFGLGKSIYVTPEGKPAEISDKPLIL